MNGRQRLLVDQQLRQNRQQHRPGEGVTLYYPRVQTACPACGFDELSQSSLDPDCPTCGGTGRVTQWSTYTSYPRIAWPKLTDFIVGLAGGIEVGDVLLYIGLEEKTLYEQHTHQGYVMLDGERYVIKNMQPAGVGQTHELVVTCARQTQ
jgi:hypothetical protein